MTNIPFYGVAALCIDHPEVQALIPQVQDRKIITYGMSPQADIRAVNVKLDAAGGHYDVALRDRTGKMRMIRDLHLPLVGAHNVQNSLAAIAVGLELTIDDAVIRKALAGIKGVKRRFTRTGEAAGLTVIDDYGHHPVEIAAVLKAARSATKGGVIAVVQPHRYTRLKNLLRGILHLLQRRRRGDRRRCLSGRRAADRGRRRRFSLVTELRAHGHRKVLPLSEPAALAATVLEVAKAGDLVVCLGGRQHHQLGLCPAAGDRTSDGGARDTAGGHETRRFAMMPMRKGHDRLLDRLPKLRGRYTENAPLAGITWFRVGGPADVMFRPADADDLAEFLASKPDDVPVTVIGVGSNLLVRDGGIRGVVVRLGRGFADIATGDMVVRTGAGALDLNVALVARDAGIGGLEFLSGIPGTIGGAIRMNGGAYGREMKDVTLRVMALDPRGQKHELTNLALGFGYRHCSAPTDFIFVSAELRGEPAAPADIQTRIAAINSAREESQPLRTRTGGSTFANPNDVRAQGKRAWS